LFNVCQKDPQLAWILLVSGHEGIIEFALSKAESARHITEKRRWMSLVRSGQSQQSAIAQQRADIKAANTPPAPQLSWEQRRQLLIQRDNQRRLQSSRSGVAARVAATPKPSPLTLHRQRLERTLNASPAMNEPITTASAPRTHSRRPKGECGALIGGKIDKLLASIRHEAVCESACCEAPVAVIEPPAEEVHDVVDLPVVETNPGADGDDRAPVVHANTGGSVGFIHQANQATAWDCMAGQGELISELRDFLKSLDDSPDLRSAATLRSLSRIRSELERIPETAALGDPVQLRLQDVMVLARQLLSRLR